MSLPYFVLPANRQKDQGQKTDAQTKNGKKIWGKKMGGWTIMVLPHGRWISELPISVTSNPRFFCPRFFALIVFDRGHRPRQGIPALSIDNAY
jgi:hypothetical protein